MLHAKSMRGLGALLGLWLASSLLWAAPHHMRFEDGDCTAEIPLVIDDVQIAYAWYGTLDRVGDVDYFTFEGEEGEEVQLYLLFPQIERQLEYYPSMALIGPGLPEGQLPDPIAVPEGMGVVQLEYSLDQLDELVHGRVYKYPPPMQMALPATGTYTVVIWHAQGEMGRYCFCHGEDHERGGPDPYADQKIEAFWKPLLVRSAVPTYWELYD